MACILFSHVRYILWNLIDKTCENNTIFDKVQVSTETTVFNVVTANIK